MKRKHDSLVVSNDFESAKESNYNLDKKVANIIIAERCNLHLHPEFSVQATAYSNKTKRLCVLRRMDINKDNAAYSKSDIQSVLTLVEFYNALNPPLIFLEKTIPLFDALDSIVWIDSWAILGGLSGKLYLFSPFTSRFRRVQLCASEILCMAQLDTDKFAVANNSGDLIILNKSPKNLETEESFFPEFVTNKITTFPSDENIISMACTMGRTSPLIAVGMVNRIRLISLQEKFEQRIIAIPHIKSNATMICSLVFVDNFLFAGDSLGQISIYNSQNGTLLKTLKSHQAHILAMTTDNKDVFASGADYRIQVISRITHDQNRSDWQQVGQRLFHTNDVRTLCFLDKNWLVSGGYEGFYISKKYMFCKPQQRPECSYSKDRGILLSRHLTNAYLWYKPSMDLSLLDPINEIKYPRCHSTPKLLLQIVGGSMGFIKQACISPNGKYVCFAGNVKGIISIISINSDAIDNFIKTANNSNEITQNHNLIEQYWNNQNCEKISEQLIEGGKTVSAMFCTNEHLYYASGEYTIIQLNFSTKQQKIIANESNLGHLIKICTNPSETLLLGITANSHVLLFDIKKGIETKKEKTILPFNGKIPYDGLFINDNCIVLIFSDLKSHFICYELLQNRKILEKSSKDFGFCVTEWIAYSLTIGPNQLLVTTNKGRVLMINIDPNQMDKSMIMTGIDNQIQSETIDFRIEPFSGEHISSGENNSTHVILVGHLEENSYRQKPIRLRFFE